MIRFARKGAARGPLSLSAGLAGAMVLAGLVMLPLPAAARDGEELSSVEDDAGRADADRGRADGAEPPADKGAGVDEDAETSRQQSQLPRIDVYLPEGRLDLRLSRLIKNALFEGQVKYDFVDGDIAAFLRYRYYGYGTIYQIGVFDAVEFENVEELDNDFERVRGFLTLLEWPRDLHRRTFLLFEFDRLSSSKEELRFSNNRSNTFVRLGFQRGTPDDPRSNALVGETRARVERLFSVHRVIGPDRWGFTAALTYSFDFLGADFSYIRGEATALKRFDLGPRTFVIGRARAGTFLDRDVIRGEEVEPSDRFSVPRSELFQLGGRENLKGVSSNRLGTEVAQVTAELFVPWFRDRRKRFAGLDWETFYVVVYGGVGGSGFSREALTESGAYVGDIGLGFETAVRYKEARFFLAALVAQSFEGDASPRTYFTIRSYF